MLSKRHCFINDEEQIEKYWTVNDELVKKELETLKPKIIISFNGRKLDKLNQYSDNNCKVIKINDPSWILQGGGGVFSENKSWWKIASNCKNKEIHNLVDNYLNYLISPYTGKIKERIRIYLLKYYMEWR